MLFYLSRSTRNNNHLEIIYRAKRHSRWAQLLKPALNIALIAFKFRIKKGKSSGIVFQCNSELNDTKSEKRHRGLIYCERTIYLLSFTTQSRIARGRENRNWIFMSHILLYLMGAQYFRSLDPGRRGERVEQPEKGSHNVVTPLRVFYCTFA